MSLKTSRNRVTAFGLSVISMILFSGAAMAAGTDAGTSVENTFSLTYEVDSILQDPVTNDGLGGNPPPTAFVVDRIVDVTVTSLGGLTVAPLEQDQPLEFSILNDGNDISAYNLSLQNPTTDDFDPTGLTITFYVDDGDGIFQTDGTDGTGTAYTPGPTAVTADVAPDSILWVLITGDIPSGVSSGQTADVILLADSFNPTTSLDPNYNGALAGTESAAETGTNDIVGAAQNVLADGIGTATGDAANSGDHSATGTYTVGAAALTATKSVSILATDGAAFGCGTYTNTQIDASQYAAPGACLEYVITVSNAGTATEDATNIDVSDFLPDGITLVGAQATGDLVSNGTLTAPAGCIPDSTAGPPVTCQVSLDDAVLAPGESGTIQIRATVTTN